MFIVLLISLSVFSVISIYNLFTAPVLKRVSQPSDNRNFVSVLIPARNEEKNIEKCLKRVLAQDYQNKEIIVLDDNSTDNTYRLVSSFSTSNVKALKGKALPTDWFGKNWACHQLAQEAKGEYLLFVDADVELKPEVISSAVYELEKSNAALLSIFPTQIIKSFGEYLIVPLMNWLLLTFLPLRFVYSCSGKAFVAANGQFMLWKKDDYFKIGGHEKVKNKVVEDMELSRLTKQNKLKIKTMLGGKLVFCRMYESFNQAYNGFTKNFFAGFLLPPFSFLVIILFLLIAFVLPFLFLMPPVYSFILIALILITRISVSIVSNQNLFINVLLHPVQMLFMFWIGINSLIKFKTKKIVWKQRKL
ncbi:MAG TPA: glycosyl transferase family 2 [Ignavibacteriales bacterium]|nr:glycosyl transferase family 2 [Ignavibacteriales bacterium]